MYTVLNSILQMRQMRGAWEQCNVGETDDNIEAAVCSSRYKSLKALPIDGGTCFRMDVNQNHLMTTCTSSMIILDMLETWFNQSQSNSFYRGLRGACITTMKSAMHMRENTIALWLNPAVQKTPVATVLLLECCSILQDTLNRRVIIFPLKVAKCLAKCSAVWWSYRGRGGKDKSKA